MDEISESSRRTVLKTIGAGMAGSALLTGAASARGNNYGNGNGVGAFLNDDAEFKDMPVWESGVADQTGQSEVEVLVGNFTSVDIPEELAPPGEDVPEELPMGYSPRAIEVSPGTEVTWSWLTPHHTVTSFNASTTNPGDHGQLFNFHGHKGDTFTYTFEEVGNYPYYCSPHGTPFPLDFKEPVGEVENAFGMRGAVIVSDD